MANGLVNVPDSFEIRISPISSAYMALAIAAGLFIAGLGVVLAIKAFLK